MEQLQVVGEFLKTHRFWLSLGLAAVFAICLTFPTGELDKQVKSQASALDASFNNIQKKDPAQPNNQWIGKVGEQQTDLKGKYETAAETLYLEQEKLMTWPAEVAKYFQGRAFGKKLDDQQNEYISIYRRVYEEEVDQTKIYWDLNVLDKTSDGRVFGVVSAEKNVIQYPVWSRDPNSMDAWYAQEALWIQRGIVKAIRKSNVQAEELAEKNRPRNADDKKNQGLGWLNAPIKRLYRINIGANALDQTVGKKDLEEYKSAEGAQAGTSPSSSSSNNENAAVNPRRYLEQNDQYRLVPVSVHLLVEQSKIPEVLGEFSNADFHYTIREVRMSHPAVKVELPLVLQTAGVTLPGRSESNPTYTAIELDVYGVMRFYEMPASIREKRSRPADAAKTEAPKVEPPKVEPPKVEPPKTEAPKAEPPKTEAPKKEPEKKDAAKSDAAKKPAEKSDAAKGPSEPKKTPAADAGKGKKADGGASDGKDAAKPAAGTSAKK